MNKSIRVLEIILMTIMLITIFSNACMASTTYDDALAGLNNSLSSVETDVKMNDFQKTAGRITKAIRNVAAVAAVIIISILGIKYMMGSVEEKAGYKKSFIPLIVGIIVVVAATSIATALFSIA